MTYDLVTTAAPRRNSGQGAPGCPRPPQRVVEVVRVICGIHFLSTCAFQLGELDTQMISQPASPVNPHIHAVLRPTINASMMPAGRPPIRPYNISEALIRSDAVGCHAKMRGRCGRSVRLSGWYMRQTECRSASFQFLAGGGIRRKEEE